MRPTFRSFRSVVRLASFRSLSAACLGRHRRDTQQDLANQGGILTIAPKVNLSQLNQGVLVGGDAVISSSTSLFSHMAAPGNTYVSSTVSIPWRMFAASS